MLVWLANQCLIRFRQRKRRKIGAYRHHLKSRPRSQPSSQGSKGDMNRSNHDVRFTPKSGH
jgi:hypothetical protein